jgi:amino acid transporter
VASSKTQPYYYAFCLGLLQAQWTISGYDASAHVSEETVHVSKRVPIGMITSVVSSGVLGLVMLIAITLAIPDLRAAQSAENPFIYIMQAALGMRLGSAMVWLCVIAMWFCGLSSLTSNSRMLYAFARDGGVPFHKWIAEVSEKHHTPAAAVWVSAFSAFALVFYGRAYDVTISISTVFIFFSYALPILIALKAQLDGRWTKKGEFQLGRFSVPCQFLAALWILFVLFIFMMPPNTLTLYGTLTASGILVALYLGIARTRFEGTEYVPL